MITQKRLDDTVEWKGLKEFGAFVLSHCQDDNLPDYEKMDLMKIPNLIPYIFVLDLRNFEASDELLYNFAGEKHTEAHGKNIKGDNTSSLYDQDTLSGEISALYRKAVNEQLTSYTKRHSEFNIDDGRKILKSTEALFFPCSSNGAKVNWGIGCVCFNIKPFEGDNIFIHF